MNHGLVQCWSVEHGCVWNCILMYFLYPVEAVVSCGNLQYLGIMKWKKEKKVVKHIKSCKKLFYNLDKSFGAKSRVFVAHNIFSLYWICFETIFAVEMHDVVIWLTKEFSIKLP